MDFYFTEVIYLLILHFIADFMCQTDEMALNKSKSNLWLSYHVLMYTMIFFIGMTLYQYCHKYFNFYYGDIPIDLKKVLIFSLITFVTHFSTDYFTSRWSSKVYAKGDRHNFFVIIGFDQLIHYTTLLLTFKLIML